MLSQKSTVISSVIANHNRAKAVFNFVIVSLCLWAIYHSLFCKNNIASLLEAMQYERSIYGVLAIVLAIVLLIPNWLLEAIKWYKAMASTSQVSLRKSIYSILTGVSFGVFTPARSGEYVGRMVYLTTAERAASLIATFRCSMAQLFVTILFGGWAFYYSREQILILDVDNSIILVAGIIALGFVLCLYIFLPHIIQWLSRTKRLAAVLEPVNSVTVDMTLQVQLLCLSAVRYAVYAVQYILVLFFCGMPGGIILLPYIAVIYFLQTLLPLPPIAAFVTRATVAVLVLTILGYNELAIISASLILWVINMAIPALCGLVILMIKNRNTFESQDNI